jgi:hypothetical protein
LVSALIVALEDDLLPTAASDDDVADTALSVRDEFELRLGGDRRRLRGWRLCRESARRRLHQGGWRGRGERRQVV